MFGVHNIVINILYDFKKYRAVDYKLLSLIFFKLYAIGIKVLGTISRTLKHAIQVFFNILCY